jgi:protein CpxP
MHAAHQRRIDTWEIAPSMTIASIRLALLAGLALPLGLATTSLAQDAPPATPAADAGHMRHMRDPAERRAHMAEHLTTVLQLQPNQQAALAAFLDSMKPPADMHDRMDHAGGDGRMGGMAHMPTPERLDRMLAHFDAMRAHLVAHAAATKQFYAQLTPSQQKVFDDIGPMMGRFGGGHRGMMDHHHGGDGEGHEMGPGGQPPG